MLEAARALLHLPLLPRAPLVFLWTGGEEPFSPVRGGAKKRRTGKRWGDGACMHAVCVEGPPNTLQSNECGNFLLAPHLPISPHTIL